MSDPKANASAKPQSYGPPASKFFRRRSNIIAFTFGRTWNPSGTRVRPSTICRNTSGLIAVEGDPNEKSGWKTAVDSLNCSLRVRRLGRVRLHIVERGLKLLLELAFQDRRFFLAQPAGVDQLLLVELPDGWAPIDLRVKIRLGEGGLVPFVVPVTPVAIQVDDNIPTELLAEIERELRDEHHRQRIVAIHMENRDLDRLGDVGRIHRRARIFGKSREADLVVHDHVHRSASAVARELRHVERFINNPLPREGGVAMD